MRLPSFSSLRRVPASACFGAVLATCLSPASAQSDVDTRSGQVRIYVSLATEAVSRLIAELKKPFPNLKIEFVRAGSVETVNRFVAERQAGRIFPDLLHGADPGGFDYFAERGWIDNRLAQLPAAENYRPGFVDRQSGWVALRATGIALMYNTKLLKQDELPKTWKDLLDRKWNGKIAISDPTRAGSAFSHLYAMWKIYGAGYLQGLAQNNVFIAGDGAATRNAIAHGERELGPVSEYDAFAMKGQGQPVEIAWPEDGTIIVPAPVALVKGSTNSANGLALATYLLSHEGQQLISNVVNSWSARNDVKAPAGKPELNEIALAHVDWKKAASEKGDLFDLYFKYFQSK
jgi:iron(III) transport system substrate-binding protein